MGLIDDISKLELQIDTKRRELEHSEFTRRDYEMRGETNQVRGEDVKIKNIQNEINALTTQLSQKQNKAEELKRQLRKVETDMSHAQQLLTEVRSREAHIASEIDTLSTNQRMLNTDLGGSSGFF